MTKQEFTSWLTPKTMDIKTGVNTNNAWGFGGARKTVYTLPNGISVHLGMADYRHMPSTSFITMYDKDNERFFDGRAVSTSFVYIKNFIERY